MKNRYMSFVNSILVLFIPAWFIACSGRTGTRQAPAVSGQAPVNEERAARIRMTAPEENTGFKLHDVIKVSLSPENRNNVPDSVAIFFDGKHVTTLKGESWDSEIPASLTTLTGRKSIKATAYKSGQPQNSVTRFMIIFSDLPPERQSYQVVHVYPHDRAAFTQGLFYLKGHLYEGTGETGSNLREVELETGKVIRQHDLDPSLFGEGITLYKERIYEVTWQNKVGFVYDLATFNLINKIYYATEGWGLTTIGDRIVMSDGSNILYFYEPEMFTVVSKIEVYDNKQKADSLNELEYINGEIWANIWMSDKIARIDPVSGKVKAYINMKGLLKESDKTPETDVLNGIAYDEAGKRIFVTGKRWPKLFEIKVR